MDSIVGVIGGVSPSSLKFNNDDDGFDKLSHRYTCVMLVIFAVIVSSKSYVGDPISCWVPAHFSGAWEDYANSYCWVKNTYYLPVEEDTEIPKQHEDDKRDMVPYYQWVPLLLLTQALMFLIPRRIWRTLNNRCAIDVDNMVDQATSFKDATKADDREKTMEVMVKQMDRFLTCSEYYKGGCTLSLKDCIARVCCPVCGRRSGNYLTLSYIVCKVMYLANVIGQLFLMDAFLDTDYHFYGIDVIQSLANGTEWRDSPRFPRVTMCDFIVRRLGNLNRYTVQCVLSINLFNEMLYLFLWFWLVLLAFLTSLSFLTWLLRMLSQRDRQRFIKKHLQLLEKLGEKDDKALKKFTDEYLRSDGVFILRLVAINTDAITVTEFIAYLWDKYRAKPINEIKSTLDS